MSLLGHGVWVGKNDTLIFGPLSILLESINQIHVFGVPKIFPAL